MKLHFRKSGAKSLLASMCAAAALLVALPSCSGGGNEDEGAGVRGGGDISPHDLLPKGANAAEIRFVGIHVLYVGWEIGTDPEHDPGIPGATPDETETPLTVVFEENGTATIALPFSSVAYADAGAPVLTGTWWQAPRAGDQPNTVMYIYFRAEGQVLQTPCIATGDNICIHLRTYTFAERGVELIGAVMSGTFTLEGPFQATNTRDGRDNITPTNNLFSQPCIYTIAGDWTPEED